jgi:hypothetical protein
MVNFTYFEVVNEVNVENVWSTYTTMLLICYGNMWKSLKWI